jgi:hypothetical protein
MEGKAHVSDIGILENLKENMPTYCERGGMIAQRFNENVHQKLQELQALEERFVRRVQNAQSAVAFARGQVSVARLASILDGGASLQAAEAGLADAQSRLYTAQENQSRYYSKIARLNDVFVRSVSTEKKYQNNLTDTKTYRVGWLNQTIVLLKQYTSQGEEKVQEVFASTIKKKTNEGLNNGVGGMCYAETLLDRLRSGKEKIKVKVVPIENGCGSETVAGSFTAAAVVNYPDSVIDFIRNDSFDKLSIGQQKAYCKQHDIDYYSGVPLIKADRNFTKNAPLKGRAVMVSSLLSQESWNEAQFDRKLTNELLPLFEGELAYDQKLVPEDSKIGYELLESLKREENANQAFKTNQALNDLLAGTNNPNMSPLNN